MFKDKLDLSYLPISLALGGIYQAAVLVNQLAMTGQCDEVAFNTSIRSIYKIDATDIADVYDGMTNVRIGLEECEKVFAEKKINKPNTHVSRYALSLLLLQNKLIKNTKMMHGIQKRIEQVLTQVRYFSETHDTVLHNLSDIYLTTISTLNFRIQIVGKAQFLKNEKILDKMRALFLAGIRSAVLWQQVGGRRWQLLFARGKIRMAVKKLLAN